MKTIITVILLLFVAASAVYLVVSELRPEAAGGAAASGEAGESVEPATETGADAPGGGQADGGAPAGDGAASAPTVTVYYFHGTLRCHTCLTMEEYAREAVEDSFRQEIDSCQVRWQALNYEEPSHEHFVATYGLYASTLLVARGEGAGSSWRRLDRIWDLVANETAFKAYVVGEVKAMLESGS